MGLCPSIFPTSKHDKNPWSLPKSLSLSEQTTTTERYNIGVVTNDIFTREDAEFLTRRMTGSRRSE